MVNVKGVGHCINVIWSLLDQSVDVHHIIHLDVTRELTSYREHYLQLFGDIKSNPRGQAHSNSWLNGHTPRENYIIMMDIYFLLHNINVVVTIWQNRALGNIVIISAQIYFLKELVEIY